jgi:hypothetical protein
MIAVLKATQKEKHKKPKISLEPVNDLLRNEFFKLFSYREIHSA